MTGVVGFLKPTRDKLVFLAEWAALIAFLGGRGDLRSLRVALVAAYPFMFFYLIACALAAMDRQRRQIAQGWRLVAVAGGLALLDQAAKAAVEHFLPYHAAVPVMGGWFAIAHDRNYSGAWVLGVLGVSSGPFMRGLQWGLAVVMLGLTPLCHRFYTATKRKSVWADVVCLGILAAVLSWLYDMGTRGYIVDYIRLPGLFTADLKDVYTSVAVGALLVEVRQAPGRHWRWRGWTKELTEERELIASLFRFGGQEVRRAWTRLRRPSGKSEQSD